MFLPREELVERCAGLLEIEKAAVEDALESGILERRLITREVKGVAAVYLAPYYYAEVKVSASLMLLKKFGRKRFGEYRRGYKKYARKRRA